MPNTCQAAAQPSRAAIVRAVDHYLAERGASARWLGLLIDRNPRLVSNLKRGRYVRQEAMRALLKRLGQPTGPEADLQPGAPVRVTQRHGGEVNGVVLGVREFRSGLWLNVLIGQGYDSEAVRVRADSVALDRPAERLAA